MKTKIATTTYHIKKKRNKNVGSNKTKKKTTKTRQKENKKWKRKNNFKPKNIKIKIIGNKKTDKPKYRKRSRNNIASQNESKRKNYNNRSKKSKLKSHQRNLFPSNDTNPQEYNCDMFRLTKAQSVSRTQLNRAKRVSKKVIRLQSYSTAALISFAVAFDFLKAATSNGKTCDGVKLESKGKEIFNTLRDCSMTVSDICNITNIKSYNQSIKNTTEECIPLLKKYGDDYKVNSDICSRKTN